MRKVSQTKVFVIMPMVIVLTFAVFPERPIPEEINPLSKVTRSSAVLLVPYRT